MQNADRRKASRQAQEIDENLYYAEEPQYTLPRNGLTYAIIIGLVGGVAALIVSIAIVLSHASLFNDAARAASQNGLGLSYQMAITLIIWQGIGALVNLLIAFVTGMIVGRTAVKRWQGFVAGALVGAILQFGLFLARYLPGYPGAVSNNSATASVIQGILGFLIFLAVYILVGGLLGLWGAAIMTRKHPYYLLRRQQARLKE